MEASSFESWLGAISTLTEKQRQRTFEALALSEAGLAAEVESHAALPQERAAPGAAAAPAGSATVPELGQRKVAATGCPHCSEAEIVRWGTSSGLPRYRCKTCGRTFNALTKTPLGRLRMREKWTIQADALIDGVSVAKAAGRCGVHYTTAFRWRHRFLAALSSDKPTTLSGIVESDETFVLESPKANAAACPGRRASAAAARPSAACPANRSR